MSTVGRRLLCSIVNKGSLNDFLTLQLDAVLFKDNELDLLEFISDHVAEHGVIPHPDTIEAKLGDVLVATEEPPSYYLQEVEKRYLQTRLKSALLEMQAQLKEENPLAALEVMSVTTMEMFKSQRRLSLYDYRDAEDLIYTEYAKQHTQEGTGNVFFGWPSLDSMSAGVGEGDYVTINGRPAAGKTFKLLYSSMHGWLHHKQTPMFVSMEMAGKIIQQRLAAMQGHKPLTNLLKGMLTTKAFNHVMGVLQENKQRPNPYWVIDANLASDVDDIVGYVRQLKPSSVWVDGAYLLKHKNTRMGKFERIGENAELLKKRVAGDCRVPVICSYQLNREVTKKKKNEAKGVEDIYGSDAMGQLSTIALGLFQEESIETQKQRHVEVMKGRHGETGGFDINWNFQTMDFSEIVEVEKKNLQFMG